MILGEFHGPQTGEVTVTIRNAEGQKVTLAVPEAALPPGPVPMLSPLESNILRVIGSGSLTGKQVARRLGRSYDSALRVILANLCERGVLETGPQGYKVKSNTPA